MIVTLLAAILGLFGPGIFSQANAASATREVQVEYDRFNRFQGKNSFRVRVRSQEPTLATLSLDQDYLDSIEIEQISPPPVSVQAAPDGMVYQLRVEGSHSPRITFEYRPARIGLIRAKLGIPGGATVEFSQFVFP